MRDFSIEMYCLYLDAIRKSYGNILTFDQYFDKGTSLPSFCLIRHDVDRKPKNALAMAKKEAEKGIRSTYYFRTKENAFKADVVKEIHALGHEIGYHYECLSDMKGDMISAREDFGLQLSRIRKLVPVSTVAMHGRPLSRYDNRDLWRGEGSPEVLKNQFGIKAEIYLHIDYSDIAYIGDTGRNWSQGINNIRDKVNSNIKSEPGTAEELLTMLSKNAPKKLIFQIHPERWSDNAPDYLAQYLRDMASNFIKRLL